MPINFEREAYSALKVKSNALGLPWRYATPVTKQKLKSFCQKECLLSEKKVCFALFGSLKDFVEATKFSIPTVL